VLRGADRPHDFILNKRCSAGAQRAGAEFAGVGGAGVAIASVAACFTSHFARVAIACF
jgi:hypothetical protein